MEVVDLLQQLNVEYRLPGQHENVNGDWIGIDCPVCSPGGGRFRLGVHTTRLCCSCWVCGYSGLLESLQKCTNLSLEALKRFWPALKQKTQSAGQLSGVKRAAGTYTPPAGVGKLREAHKNFLVSRGFRPALIAQLWRVGGIGIAARLAWRLFIPVTLAGAAVSWTTRAVLPDDPRRYWSARSEEESVSHKDLLYGEDLVPGHAIAVQEGAPDAWAIGPGAVATLGVGTTPAQVMRIAKYNLRIICFDTEPAAQRRADKLVGELSAFPGKTVNVRFETGKDASRANKREVIQLREMLR